MFLSGEHLRVCIVMGWFLDLFPKGGVYTLPPA